MKSMSPLMDAEIQDFTDKFDAKYRKFFQAFIRENENFHRESVNTALTIYFSDLFFATMTAVAPNEKMFRAGVDTILDKFINTVDIQYNWLNDSEDEEVVESLEDQIAELKVNLDELLALKAKKDNTPIENKNKKPKEAKKK